VAPIGPDQDAPRKPRRQARRKSKKAPAPRPRRCLLKGCNSAPFQPRHPFQRYCSEECRSAARLWSVERAREKYARSERGREQRREQAKRHRKLRADNARTPLPVVPRGRLSISSPPEDVHSARRRPALPGWRLRPGAAERTAQRRRRRGSRRRRSGRSWPNARRLVVLDSRTRELHHPQRLSGHRRSGNRTDGGDGSREGDHKEAHREGNCCARPGCYERFLVTRRSPLQRFCSSSCRLALARVIERERRWRARLAGWVAEAWPPVEDEDLGV
jgi:hypothetical protein